MVLVIKYCCHFVYNKSITVVYNNDIKTKQFLVFILLKWMMKKGEHIKYKEKKNLLS